MTELTDVPHELNGALDLDRRPKPDAVKELTRANQPTLPMLALTTFSVVAGCALRPPLYVANDRDTQTEVELEIQLGGSRETRWVGTLRGHVVSALGEVELEAPAEAGEYSLLLRLAAAGRLTAENDYPLTVLARPRAEHAVCLLGSGHTADALAALGARLGEAGPIIVAEGALDAVSGAAAASALEAGETVLILAQQPGASSHYPVPATLREVATEWGPSMFHYTTDHGALPSLPRRTLLTTEDASIKPLHELMELDGGWAAETVVAAFKPLPWLLHSTVVGVHPVGRGRLIVCQYRLAGRACGGDPLARAVLADLVGLAAGEGG